MDVGHAAGSTITTDEASAAVAPAFECAPSPSPPGVLRAIDMLAINSAGSAGGGSPSSPGSPMMDSPETPAQVSGGGGGGAMGGGVGGAESVTSPAAGSNESHSEEGVYDGGSARAASSSESRAGSRRSRDRSSSDDSSSGRSTRQRRAGGGGGGGGGGASGRSSRRSRYRDEGRHNSGGSSVSSQSPRWDRAAGGGGGGGGASPRRRGGGGGGGDGSPRQTPEPSKVLHVRNVGYPVVQGDLVALLSCFGQVEKIKMFSGQALVQLPSVSVAKATMRHYEEDAEPKIGQKRVYLNYSRSRSIETRDGESLAVGATAGGGNFNSNNGGASNGGGGGGGGVNGGNNGLDLARAINAARGVGGMDGGSTGNPMQETPSPYAHLIMEDHAKLLGLATCYLQTYGIPGGEGAILNINQREEMAERQRQAMAAAFALTGANGHALHHAGMGAWNGNAAAAAAAAAAAVAAEAGRHSRGVSGGGGGGGAGGAGGVFSTGYAGRPRSGSRGRAGEGLDRLRR
ncbi:unnamed protein product [Ectocarpus sp. 13 AM-2016]